MLFLRYLIISILFVIASASAAANAPQAFGVGSMHKLKQDAKNHPVIVAFWATDCTYCYEELSLLREWGKKHPEVKVVLVATDPPDNQTLVIQMLRKHGYSPESTSQFNDNYVEKIRYDIDKRWMGELPRSYFLRGNQMKAISGTLTEKQLNTWVTKK